MSINKIFALLALITVIGTGFFGVCAIQHTPSDIHGMQNNVKLSEAVDMGDCPLSGIFNTQILDEYSSVDPSVFGFSVSPSAERHLIASKIKDKSNGKHPSNLTLYDFGGKAPDGIISITSPPLKEAYSQGILNPKKPLSA